ncbi:MAG: hypothetical protein H7222_07140 [Methylotenera sp.]|nr:hypothetical protein [Oligoflexia bacterium]
MKNFTSALTSNQKNLGSLLFKLLLAFTFLHASVEKFAGGGVPDWFSKQFATTIIASLPGGVGGGFYGIAALEAVSGISLVLAIVFSLRSSRQKADFWAAVGFLLSEVTFFALGAGLRISHQYSEAASLFQYFTATLILHVLLTELSSDRVS